MIASMGLLRFGRARCTSCLMLWTFFIISKGKFTTRSFFSDLCLVLFWIHMKTHVHHVHPHVCVTAAGLRAGNTWYTFVTAGVGPAVVCSGSSQHSVRYGDEYYFSTFVGQAPTNLTGRWQALFARYFWLRGCWPSGFLINVTRIITKSGDRHQSGFGRGYGYPGKIRRKRRRRVCFIYKRISGGSRNGPGRELHGTIWEGPYSKMATGQKTLNTGRGLYLRGPADDITLRHYGTCDICRSFGDAVCIMAPATAICTRKWRCRSRAL